MRCEIGGSARSVIREFFKSMQRVLGKVTLVLCGYKSHVES
jgi:hypothetical protein